MSKFVAPGIFVPGATPVMEGEGLLRKQAKDKKGRPLWNMPEPSGTHKTTGVSKDGRHEKMVPVYRGVSASFARYIRSQHKRAQRKMLEQSARASEQNEADELCEFVLNPGD